MRAFTNEREIPVTDEQLMAAVRDGDVSRLGELFERHGRLFYGYFVRLTGNPDASHDLLQEMFLRMLKYRRTYREQGSFRAWAFRIARNLANDLLSRPRREVPLEVANDVRGPTVLPLAQIEKAQDLRALHHAFADLPAEKREILTLSYFERLPYAEIAEILSCSVGAVKVRVHRAVRDLRAIFETQMQEGQTDDTR